MPKDCTRRVMTVRLFVSCGLRVCRNLLVMLLVAQGSSGNANGTETPRDHCALALAPFGGRSSGFEQLYSKLYSKL